jgi:hypothetical protein
MDGVAIAGTGLTIATVKQSNSMLNWRSLMQPADKAGFMPTADPENEAMR